MLYLLIAAPVAVFIIAAFKSNQKSRQNAFERKGMDLDSFTNQFDGAGFSHDVLKVVYSDLIELIGHPAFRYDNFEKTLLVDAEDLEYKIVERGREAGINDLMQPIYYEKLFPIKTVDDYVRFVDWILTHPATVGETQ